MSALAPEPDGVPLRDAATVMLVRDGESGLEVFMMRRNLRSDFVGGAYVFPGGAVDADDATPEVSEMCVGLDDSEASRRMGVAVGGLAYWVAAIRESFEEAGLLLAVDGSDRLVTLDAGDPTDRFGPLRRAVDSGDRRLVDVCRSEGLRLAADRLEYFSRWITPLGAPRRYDTRFFVAHAPAEQVPLHDDRETIASVWVHPPEALARCRAGQLEMIFPTIRTLEALCHFDRADDLVDHAARSAEVEPVLPTMLEVDGSLRIVLTGADGSAATYDAFTAEAVPD